MRAVSKLYQKKPSELQPGEVFWISAGTDDFLNMFVRRLDNGDGVWVNLTAAADGSPAKEFATNYQRPCLSYGTDCVVEFCDSEYCRPQSVRRSGSALIDDGELVLLCVEPNGNFGNSYVNFNKLEEEHMIGGNPIPVEIWKIWASEADYLSPHAEPIFTSTLKLQEG